MSLRARHVAAAALVAVLASCSLDYGSSTLTNEISDDTPDTILYDVTHTVVRDGSPRFVVKAQRAENFDKRKRQYLESVEFTELAADGTVVTNGTADSAVYETDTENFQLTGNLHFYSAEEDAWLTAQTLVWTNATRTLASDPGELVIVERGDGTRIRGRGFVAEMGRSIIRFEDGVSGTLIEKNEQDASQ